MASVLHALVVAVYTAGVAFAKTPEGFRAIPDAYHGNSQHHRANGAHHISTQANTQEARQTPIPLYNMNRVRGVYLDGKPVVAGVSQAVPLTPIGQPNAVVDSPRSKSIFGVPGIVAPVQSQGIEYYDDFVNGAPFSAGSPAASAYIPTAPYPASVYGRPPFWIRLQRWNPFSRYYRATYTIGAPEYPNLPSYGYVVPPVMVIPARPVSTLEPIHPTRVSTNSQTLVTSQRRYGRR
ncbi:uncharacterized protein LOC111269915 isoform X1 [Varroa jacobsoni]|uniref:uncharacterized protein LOC111269915 isoform X1 n=1 Tax=Varroa jacobsoni TaxID=62625 RepID=UPI000BF8747E|nr:uncharacterized protein LOC111269915 isoform X1 [Varroa jacobsoni]